MCSIPPAPPPPPPVLPDMHSPTKSPKTDSQSPMYTYSDVCEWASEHPSLWEVCIKYNLCLKKAPFKYRFTNINSILQVGPTCGMAALSMLVKGEVSAEEILSIAKLEGFSNNGEMFSCINMTKLAEKVFSLFDTEQVKCSVKNGGLTSKETIDKMLEGAVLLVPYDAYCNHSPCLKNGHTAHWGLICGIIIVEDAGEFYLINKEVRLKNKMCSIPPAPPPPPPVLPDMHSPTKSPKTDSQSPMYTYSDVCEWASEHPSLWEVCIKYNLCLKKAPFKYRFTNINSILQVGPTCGMAALSMLVKGEVSAEEILSIAKLEGFSNNGEMFSCINMTKLAEKVFSLFDTEQVKCSVKNGGLTSKETIDKMLEGAVLLVPYDAYCNHSPCLKNGHTAHWGLICGIIIVEDAGEFYLIFYLAQMD